MQEKDFLLETQNRISQETLNEHFLKSLNAQDELIDTWIKMGADVNINYGQALAMAVQAKNPPRMKLLLENGANPRLLQDYSIKIAIANIDLAALELLYQYVSADSKAEEIPREVNSIHNEEMFKKWYKNMSYWSTAEFAIATNNLEIVKLVLENDEFRRGYELFRAIETKNIEIVELAKQSCMPAGISSSNSIMRESSLSSIMQSAVKTNDIPMIEYCKDTFCDGQFPRGTFEHDLETSIILCLNSETLKYLMKFSYMQLGLEREKEWQYQLDLAFNHALISKDISILEMLYTEDRASKIKLSSRDLKVKHEKLYEFVEWLISHEILEKNENLGREIMDELAELGKTKVMELLKENGVECTEKTLVTALIFKRQETIKYLLESAKLDISEEKAQQWIENYCRQKEDFEITRMLISSINS